MNSTNLKEYVDGLFARHGDIKDSSELKADLLADLEERFSELKAAGKDDESAFLLTVQSIGDMEEIADTVANSSKNPKQQIVINFSGTNLSGNRFHHISLKDQTFHGSAMKGVDFTGSDLTGSKLKSSALTDAIFDNANLTDCDFSSCDLKHSRFINSTMVRTVLNACTIVGATFEGIEFTDVLCKANSLCSATFLGCSFLGTEFKSSDLTGCNFSGVHLTGTTFDNAYLKNASFENATLKNVAFKASFALTNRFYKALATINFAGASMDTLTALQLKNYGVDLKGVTVL